MAAVLDVRHLQKTYWRWELLQRKRVAVEALRDVSLSIRKREIFGLLGPNGAGKTTMVNVVAGIVTNDAGSVRLFGEELTQAVKGRMNVATAYKGLLLYLTVFQNLKFYGRLYGVPRVDQRIQQLLRQFRIEHLKDKRFYLLSSGEKTRVNLCKGLINEPEFLMLDEATVGLDPDIAQHVREEIRKLETTILFTSHNMYEVEELCDRVAFLHKGRILRTGTPSALTRLITQQLVTIDFSPGTKSIAAALKRLGVEIVSHDGLRAVLRVPHAERKLHDILHPLFAQGFLIKDLAIQKPSLEDVFLSIARGAR